MQYHHLHKGINTSDEAATSCKNLVTFGAVTPEINFLMYTFVWWLGENCSIYSSLWHFQTRWTIELSMGAFKAAMDVYSSYQSINQFILSHTNSINSNVKISTNTFILCVTGSTRGAYAPHKRATHVQWAKLNIFITIQRLQEKKRNKKIKTSKRM